MKNGKLGTGEEGGDLRVGEVEPREGETGRRAVVGESKARGGSYAFLLLKSKEGEAVSVVVERVESIGGMVRGESLMVVRMSDAVLMRLVWMDFVSIGSDHASSVGT